MSDTLRKEADRIERLERLVERLMDDRRVLLEIVNWARQRGDVPDDVKEQFRVIVGVAMRHHSPAEGG